MAVWLSAMNDVRNWAGNPRLNTWLERQRADFPAWARETGQQWDFTVESLDRLEELLRKRFAGWEELHADPFGEIRGLFVRSPDHRLRDVMTRYGG